MIDSDHGSAGVIQKVLRGINAQDPEDRVVEIAGAKRLFFRSFPEVIRGTDESTALNAAARHKARHRVAPMVAAWTSLTEWRATVAAHAAHMQRAILERFIRATASYAMHGDVRTTPGAFACRQQTRHDIACVVRAAALRHHWATHRSA